MADGSADERRLLAGRIVPKYSLMVKEILLAILDRFDADEDYPFIDTKLDLVTGEDFEAGEESSSSCKGKNVIYTWIQGRGLEAMAGHLEWAQTSLCFSNSTERESVCARITALLKKVSCAMEAIRSANNGRLFFSMTRDGAPVEILDCHKLKQRAPLASDLPTSYSDLFYSKGLLKAAASLGNADLMNAAMEYFERSIEDVEANRFRTDQQTFDPKNQVKHIAGKRMQGPFMISLLGLAEAFLATSDTRWLDTAQRFIRHILDFHVVHNNDMAEDLQCFDFFEAVDEQGKPWKGIDGKIVCDPGHALEFIGLSSKCLLEMIPYPKYCSFIGECNALLPKLFVHVFRLGFNPSVGGIFKSFDLVGRKAMNTDMPWWSLPEAIRAGCNLLTLSPDCDELSEITDIIAACADGFMKNYVNKDVHMMAFQTISEDGRVADIIPATPDADPGYHTSLSIIDAIKHLKR